jgi:DMSO/TMAO reductase YedYZ molybdopterin-dependent catalytic subunit
MDGHDPLHPHRHDPNYEVPDGDGTFTLHLPNGSAQFVTVADLQALPFTELPNCYIVSTGHGTTGPFTFGGVRLIDLIAHYVSSTTEWSAVEVISGDGFGNRLYHTELTLDAGLTPPLLAYTKDGTPLSRTDGLVRLIVPTERDDALRQVKWIAIVRIVNN